MTVRERLEQEERTRLSPYAKCTADTAGRASPISPDDLRTDFQRDRDRIIHCKSFRRLKYKTQVFLSPVGDHYRTRLTHTLEVAQVARTLARCLRLNEDLTEAIALGHDLGHTPFGHMGERILNRLSPGGFSHEMQSLRVVEVLENDGAGLNLTEAVRDGIAQHPSHGHPATREGEVVSLSDRIAYINHDIDDAVRAGVLRLEEIPKALLDRLGHTHGDRIDTMIGDVVQREEDKAERMLESLFDYYLKHPEQMPPEYLRDAESGVEQAVCDYIAGMTDNYAVHKFADIFIPKHEILLG